MTSLVWLRFLWNKHLETNEVLSGGSDCVVGDVGVELDGGFGVSCGVSSSFSGWGFDMFAKSEELIGLKETLNQINKFM